MDDLITFINARLDEDEAAAYGLAGTTWTVKRLGDHDYEIYVAHDPLIHAVAPTDGIADVQREDVAEHIARYDPRRAQREVAAKRAIVARYQRGKDGDLPEWKAGRELIEAALAILLGVLRDIAAVWSDHPDYQAGWAQ